MSYQITKYTKDKAKEIGVDVKPSRNPKKKIDVYRDGIKIESIGAIGYSDYSTYIKDKGQKYADKRRDLFHQRHKEETLGGLLAKWLLW